MRLTIEQGELVKGHTYPNPPVGALILDRDGEAVGTGATEPTEAAEVVALGRAGGWRSAAPPSSRSSRGNHMGTTPPCVDARVDGFSTVVYAVADPSPIAAGGATHLAAAGVADLFGPPDSFRSYGIRASRLTDGAT